MQHLHVLCGDQPIQIYSNLSNLYNTCGCTACLQTVKLVSEFDSIVYISCNPETLHANLRDLAPTHRIVRFAAFDQVRRATPWPA